MGPEHKQPAGRSGRAVAWLGGYWRRAKLIFGKLIRSRSTPHQIALGAAIGIIVSWTPTIGLQMAIAVPLCLLFRANPLAAIPPIWLTNPVTAVPVFSFNYWVGRLLIGGPSVAAFRASAEEAFREMRDGRIGESMTDLLALGEDVLWPLLLGCLTVGFALAVPTYAGTYLLVDRLRRRLARLRADGRRG